MVLRSFERARAQRRCHEHDVERSQIHWGNEFYIITHYSASLIVPLTELVSSDSLQTYFFFTSFYVRGPVLVELQKVVHDNLRCGRCGPSIFQAKRGFDIWQHANLNRINSLNSAFYNCYVIQLTFTAFSLLFIINLCLDVESIELYVEWDFELYVMHKLCTYTETRLKLLVVHIDTSVSINNIR